MNEATPVSYTAVCERVGRWWEITVTELDEVTQARTLNEVPETVADLVATMTGADPSTVQVRVEAEVGPGLMPADHAEPDMTGWSVETASLPDGGGMILYLAPPGLTDVERQARARAARNFVAELEREERDEPDEQGRAG